MRLLLHAMIKDLLLKHGWLTIKLKLKTTLDYNSIIEVNKLKCLKVESLQCIGAMNNLTSLLPKTRFYNTGEIMIT